MIVTVIVVPFVASFVSSHTADLEMSSRIMKIGITSTDKSVMDLSMLAYWTIRQRLLGVPGVANIAIWGEQLKMLQVMVDPKRLAAADVTLDQVQEAVSDSLDVGLLRYARGDAGIQAALRAQPQAEIRFNYLGQLTSGQNELIPLAQGNVFFPRNPPFNVPPSVVERPPGNGTNSVTYNVVSIDWLTGRARAS